VNTFITMVVLIWLGWQVVKFLYRHAGRFYYGPRK